MNKSELFKSRERRILAAALSTARNKGALDFRMVDVARVAECSVGTLYGHFLSKEDMMVALVQLAVQRRATWFDQVKQLPLSNAEKFMVLLLSERRRLAQDEVLAQLEILVSHTELWCRAADQRQCNLREAGKELSLILHTVVADAITANEIDLDSNASARLVETARALMLGVQLQSSRQTLATVKMLQDETILMDTLMLMLSQAGFATPSGNWHERCFEALRLNQLQLERPILAEEEAA